MNATQLKDWRKGRAWDQERMAAELKVSIHTVRSWEQGKNPVPHWVEKQMLSEAQLKVPLDLIARINSVAAERSISFDDALALVLQRGLAAETPPTKSPTTAKRGARGKGQG